MYYRLNYVKYFSRIIYQNMMFGKKNPRYDYTISNFNVHVAILLHISGVVIFLSRPSRRLFVAFLKEDS